VDGVLMPPIGKALGRVDFANLFIDLSGQNPASLAEAKAKGWPVIAYGALINDIISFLIIAFVVFLIVKAINRTRREEAATTQDCRFCLTAIPIGATRCAACCSDLTPAA
jgi:large conductance mechanosensitive channel